jgi:hypothetical protein
VVAEDLTGQAHAGQAARGEHGSLRLRAPFRLSSNELDAACRAPRLSAAGVQLVHVRVFLEREHEALSFRDLKRSEIFDRKLWHRSHYIVRAP